VWEINTTGTITSEGVVLSHPHSKTTPSIGLARIDSSHIHTHKISEEHRVGSPNVSPSDMTGNSSGNPPASNHPFLTDSPLPEMPIAGVSSLQVLQIPITGLPSKQVRRNALVLHPGTVNESVFATAPKPILASKTGFSMGAMLMIIKDIYFIMVNLLIHCA